MAATGHWSLADLARFAVEQGFTMPPVRRRRTLDEILAEEDDDIRLEIEAIERLPTFNSIHKILTNPFYAGKAMGNNGKYVASASHEPIVSEGLFDSVQDQLRRRNKSAHYIKLLDHPLRGVARCAVCRRLYTPYLKKGIVYYGARCDRNCTNTLKSFNFDFIAEKAGAVIQQLVFTEKELVTINASATTDIALIDHRRERVLEEEGRKKKRLREELAYITDNRLPLLKAGVYTPEAYVEEEARLSRDIQAFDLKEEISCTSTLRTIEEVLLLSELLNNVVEV